MAETTLENLHDSLVANVEADKVLCVIEQISLGVKDAVKIIDALNPEMPTIICVKYLPKNAQKLFAQSNAILRVAAHKRIPCTGCSTARPFGYRVRRQRAAFDNRTLKKLVSVNPTLDCECPNQLPN